MASALFFSPDRLAMFGNALGHTGTVFLAALISGIGVQLATAGQYRVLISHGPDKTDYLSGLNTVVGTRWSAVLILCARMPFGILAVTGLVVSAGFVFNEVFFYSFPNFAFAYLILIGVAVLNLISTSAVGSLQTITVAGALTGIVILSLAAFGRPLDAVAAVSSESLWDSRYLAAGILVLLGIDLGLDNPLAADVSPRGRQRRVMLGVVVGGLVLLLWGVVSLRWVPDVKLAGSTVPHMTAARTILGQTGRQMMGTVVICGAIASVNALLFSIGQIAARVSVLISCRPEKSPAKLPERLGVVTATVIAAALMASGMAGEPILETLIRASMILWLVTIVAIHAAANHLRVEVDSAESGWGERLKHMGLRLAAAGIALSAAGLMMLETNPGSMLVFLVGAPVAIWAGVVFWQRYATLRRPVAVVTGRPPGNDDQ